MNTADEIRARVEQLSEERQAEVLDFVEYLAAREAEEDREDLAAIEEQRDAPTRPLEAVVEDFKARGLL
ncbi:MAG: DUF2281 domain-containing protein [Deltaproteobacteria bacterium]|nr:DUF2281 domain-containing protein [Deltaproteobacteria bacterium]